MAFKIMDIYHENRVERVSLDEYRFEVVKEPVQKFVFFTHLAGSAESNRVLYDLRYWEFSESGEVFELRKRTRTTLNKFRVLDSIPYYGVYTDYAHFERDGVRYYFLFLPNEASMLIDTSVWNFSHGPGSPTLTITKKAS